MLAIRLMRTGKIHQPHYRIVVQEKRSKLNGKAIDTLGHYHPADSSKQLVIDKDKAQAWLAKGAQASDTVTNLFVKDGILDKTHKVSHHFTPNPKAEVAAPAAPAAEVAEETTTEVAEEVATEETPAAETTEEVVEAPAEETPEVATEEAPAEEATPEETPAEEA